MKILLVQPSVRGESESFEASGRKLQPLPPGVIAALVPDGHSVDFIDDRFERIPYESEFDLVGITTTTLTAGRAYSIADKFRKRGVEVLIGGHHASLVREEAKEHADSVLVGEAEGVLPEILEDFRRGDTFPFYQLEEKPEAASFPSPDRSIYEGKDYLPLELVETTRGCPYNCSFCSVSAFFGPGYRHKPVESVVEEVKGLSGKNVFFIDDNIVGDPAYAKELFRALIPLKIHWFGQASITMAGDEELLDLMKKSGCMGNLVGFESVNEESLNEVNKSWNLKLPMREAVRRIHSHGLAIFASFIIGLDHDVHSTVEETYRFAVDSKFLGANFNYPVPYPGTELFRELKRSGRLRDERWWLNDRFNVVRFDPVNFTRKELWKMINEVKNKFYNYDTVFLRALNLRANLGSPRKVFLYWAINKSIHDERYSLKTSLD